jgi:hypothetical protein
VAYRAGVAEESHRDAMNHAIRAQRERGNVPRSMLPPEDEPISAPAAPAPVPEPTPEAEPEPELKRGFLSRLFGRQ